MKITGYLLITLAVFAASPTTAHARDGHTLLEGCSHSINPPAPAGDEVPLDVNDLIDAHGDGYCLGIVEGALYMNYLYQTMDGVKPLFCRPSDSGDMRPEIKIVVDWLNANPDKLDESALSTVAWAMADAYPCK